MRSYSRFRWVVLAALLAVGMFLAGDGWAQTTAPADGATEEARGQGILSLILSHIDAVFITIAALSVIGLALIIQGFIKTRASVFMPEATTNQIRDMIAQRKFSELIDFTENDPSFISKAINPALKRAPSFSAMKEAMETAIGEQTAERFRSIEYLNIIGNLGPLLGLLGTVLGMVYAFQAVAASGGQADVGKLSYGISTALCHTFLGLFLAVPCLAAFGVLRTMVDRLTVRGALVAEELLLMMKPAEAKTAPARPVPQPATARKPAPTAPPSAAPAVPAPSAPTA